MTQVDIWFEEGSGEVPQLGVSIPRVPCVGETITGPDGMGSYEVASVSYLYADGFAFPPSRILIFTREMAEVQAAMRSSR